jgi:hypothetical protein
MKSVLVCFAWLFFFISAPAAAFASFQDNGDGTVTDSETGLIWQKTPSAETKNWQDALAACTDLSLAGKSDWRLPNRNELQSIVDYRWHHPAIDSRSFPNVIGGNFWTSTTDTFSSPAYAYAVDFTGGAVYSHGKADNSFQMLAVRGGSQAVPEETFFQDNQNGTVTDSRTGLVWLQAPLDMDNDGASDALTWQAALAGAAALEKAGFTDWRLPNRNELQSIVDYRWHHPAIDSRSFPNVIGGNFWTSTTDTFSSPAYAYAVDFTGGAVYSYDKAGNSFQALVVRGKQSYTFDSSNFFKFTGIPSAIPAAATENTPFTIEVFANDPAFNGTINLSIHDGGGVNPSSVSLVNGHWQGNISVTRPGNTRLIALYTPLIGDFLSGSSEWFYVSEDQNAETKADLQLTITKRMSIFSPGDNLEYSIYVKNLSTDLAPETVIDVTWSTGFNFNRVECSTSDDASCQKMAENGSSVKFKTSIRAGQYSHIQIYGQAKEGFETITLAAQTYDVQVHDPLVSNNSSVATLQTDIPDLPGIQDSQLIPLPGNSATASSADTVVLTHGLQSQPCAADELWTGKNFSPAQAGYLIQQAMKKAGKPVNIYQFFWKGACHVTGVPEAEEYKAARQNVYFAAQQLAEQLFGKLGPNYDKKIHFIGHSLGTAVNAYAADMFLRKATKVSKVQVTILDHPSRVSKILWMSDKDEKELGFDENFFAQVLPFNKSGINLYVDNYYASMSDFSSAGVGTPVTGNVFNRELEKTYEVKSAFLNEEHGGNDHYGVHQWYRWKISPNDKENFFGDSVCPDGKWNGNPKFLLMSKVNSTLNPCPEKDGGWHESILINDPINFPSENGGNAVATNSTAAETSIKSPHGCSAPAGNFVATVCAEAGAPYPSLSKAAASQVSSLEEAPQIPKSSIEFTVTVPEFLRYISFDYSFGNLGDGDYVYIFLDGVPIWKMSGGGLTAGETVSSGLIPVRAEAGQKKLIIALYGVGEQNAQFSLNNFKFTTVADTDGDGTADDDDAFPNNPGEQLDTDKDGIGNNADLDDDGDGINDAVETIGCTDPLNPDSDHDTLADGTEDADHDGVLDPGETNPCLQDTDNDGVLDQLDGCPTDPNKTVPGTCETGDSDNDGLLDTLENQGCTSTSDADTDDDGIIDGIEDINHNGTVDTGETDPCKIDSDNDGIQDGTELGYTATDVGPHTNLSIFQPDLDSASKTNPRKADSDEDGISDGTEDSNHNGRVDAGESNPTVKDVKRPSAPIQSIIQLLLK